MLAFPHLWSSPGGTAVRSRNGAAAVQGGGAAYRFSPSQKPLSLLLLDRPLVVPPQRLQRFLVAGHLPVKGVRCVCRGCRHRRGSEGGCVACGEQCGDWRGSSNLE